MASSYFAAFAHVVLARGAPAKPQVLNVGAIACLSSRATTRSYHETPARLLPYKDDQDRTSVKPHRQEYSKGEGGDDAVASEENAAFDPSKTRPETEKDQAARGKKANGGGEANPLEASPANKNLSQPKPQENKASGQAKEKRSGGGGVKK